VRRARKGKAKPKQPSNEEDDSAPDDAKDDEESRSSNESRSSQASRSRQVKFEKKVAQDMKLMAKANNKDLKRFVSKAFTQLEQRLASPSDISFSDDYEEYDDNGVNLFQFTQVSHRFESPIDKLLTHPAGTATQLDLREVVLLDSQSTVDLFCNRKFVKRPYRSNKRLNLETNGGTVVIHNKAELPGFHAPVWYDTNAVTNILSFRNLIKQYPISYDSDNTMFVVHRESDGKRNMEFRMHKSGLHYFDPRRTASNDDVTTIPAATDAEIAAVTDAEIAAVAYAATITGVDGVNDETPTIESDDLHEDATATTPHAEPVETAPATSQEPRATRRVPRAKSPEPIVNNARFYTSEVTSILEPGAKSQERRATRQEPSAKSPEPRVNNARFYTSEVNSILCNQNKKTNCAPKRTRSSLVPKGNHRSVL
jgi:hypothetical protein